jgi:hypothetical protein
VFVSLPLRTPVMSSTVEDLRQAGVEAHAFRSWIILEQRGPFADGKAALAATAAALERAARITGPEAPSANGYLQQIYGAACAALTRLGSGC